VSVVLFTSFSSLYMYVKLQLRMLDLFTPVNQKHDVRHVELLPSSLNQPLSWRAVFWENDLEKLLQSFSVCLQSQNCNWICKRSNTRSWTKKRSSQKYKQKIYNKIHLI